MASSGAYRLYALDLVDHMDLRIKISWYVDLKLKKMPRSTIPYSEKMHVNSEDVHDVVTYLQDIVYVNIPVSASSKDRTYVGALWGIKDHGNHASVLFNTTGTYGQIALYDTYSLTAATKKLPDDEHVIWISNRQNLIVGYNSATGRVTGHINITALANITVITSKLAITHQPLASPSSDNILVLGGTDRNGTAFLVALETDTSGKARLLWKTSLNDNSSSHDVTWQIVGQLSNIALAVPDTNVSAIKWQLCVVAMVLESGNGYNKLHVKTVWGY